MPSCASSIVERKIMNSDPSLPRASKRSSTRATRVLTCAETRCCNERFRQYGGVPTSKIQSPVYMHRPTLRCFGILFGSTARDGRREMPRRTLRVLRRQKANARHDAREGCGAPTSCAEDATCNRRVRSRPTTPGAERVYDDRMWRHPRSSSEPCDPPKCHDGVGLLSVEYP